MVTIFAREAKVMQLLVQLPLGHCTMTRNEQLLTLPQQSVATQETRVVVPGAKVEQDGGVQTTLTLVHEALLAVTV
jgi:hypothetical protein